MVNELIGGEIAKELDEWIWIHSVDEDSSSKLGDPFRENYNDFIIIHSNLFRYSRNYRALTLLVRTGTVCQSIKDKDRTAPRHQLKSYLIQLLRDYPHNNKEIKFPYKLSETTFKILK